MNYYKALAITIFLSLGFISYGQNNVYMLTEKFDCGTTATYDSVFVTSPVGVVTTYSIPNLIAGTASHDSQLNIIVNGITSQGYVMSDLAIWTHGVVIGGVYSCWRVIYFKQP
jgi:hypothetical protein